MIGKEGRGQEKSPARWGETVSGRQAGSVILVSGRSTMIEVTVLHSSEDDTKDS